MDIDKISNFFFNFFNIDFLSINGFYLKCILIVTKVNLNFFLEFNRGERDIFSGSAGIFLYYKFTFLRFLFHILKKGDCDTRLQGFRVTNFFHKCEMIMELKTKLLNIENLTFW